ncbi:hypothetical protein [Sulfurospirillum oryzae]|uniref:hypothetical protein n=1 Tax=Sulfurospirillum oryzae TaxID=2976535 RepID=UPI0021E99BDD|nr:hypothetical protein [Sulfurospirillum oryzae]
MTEELLYVVDSSNCPSLIPTCSADEKLDTATNTCVPKTVDPNNPNCDPVASQFNDVTTGKCFDCMPFGTFGSRAACACNAHGSTYTPVLKGVAYYSTQGQYTYKKQRATCDDGSSVFIYYDPLNNNPQDYNNTTPTDTNGTKIPDTNTTTTSPTDLNGTVVPNPSQADVVNALKQIENGQKDSNTALRELGVDLKTINTSLKEQGYTFDSILNKIKEGNDKADARYKLMDDEFKGQTQWRNMMGKWVDKNALDVTAQLGATVDVKKAVDGTTGAVNAQGKAITDKLGEIKDAIKDINGTDMKPTNDILEKIKKDTNATAKGVDKLHDDLNTTNTTLDKIKGLFDNNDSFKVPDVNDTKFELSDLMPDDSWFESNKLNLNFNNYGGECYCQTAEFRVAGKTFVFPPQEALDIIPFTTISNIFMAFIYVLGLKAFLKD